MSTTFVLVFVAAAPFWALMIFAPTWRGTKAVTATPWIVAPSLAGPCLDPDLVAVSPTDVPYDLLDPEQVPVVRLDGSLVDGERRPTSELPLHLPFDVQRLLSLPCTPLVARDHQLSYLLGEMRVD